MLEIFKYSICGMLTTLTAIIYGYTATNIKKNYKNYELYVGIILSTILYVLFNYIELGELKSILNTLMIVLTIMYILKQSIIKSIFISLCHSIILLFSEIILFFIMIGILKVNKECFYNKFAGSITGNIIIFIIFVIILLVLRKGIKKITSYKVSSNKQIIIFSVLTTICVFIFFYNGFEELQFNNNLLISIFSIIVFIVILFSLIKQKITNGKISDKYNSLVEFTKSYEEVIDEQRMHHHESKNQLINIKSKLMDKDKSQNIIKYIDSILNEKINFCKEKYSKLKYLPSNGFKGLFYYKISKAEERNIKVSINISSEIKNSYLHDMTINNYKELCQIIGVYLDNAIEASYLAEDKLLGIEMYVDKGDISIIISNSYIGEINLHEIEKRGYSTKGKGRGYGLSLVKYIISNNDIFDSPTQVTEKLYIQKLIIKKPSE